MPRSMTNRPSLRWTASERDREIAAALLPRRALAAMSASSKVVAAVGVSLQDASEALNVGPDAGVCGRARRGKEQQAARARRAVPSRSARDTTFEGAQNPRASATVTR